MYFQIKHVDEYMGKKKISYLVISYNGGLSMFSVFNIITKNNIRVTNWFTNLTINNLGG